MTDETAEKEFGNILSELVSAQLNNNSNNSSRSQTSAKLAENC